MQFKLITILSLLGSTALGFTIPENQEDGAFGVTFDADGKENVAKIAELPKQVAREEPSAARRSSLKPVSAKYGKRDQNGCTKNDYSSSEIDYLIVEQCMKDTFSEGVLVAKHKIFYCRSGTVFLALCNYSGDMDQGGYPYEVDNFNALIDGKCGAWKSGWNLFSGPNKTLWRDIRGTAICTNI